MKSNKRKNKPVLLLLTTIIFISAIALFFFKKRDTNKVQDINSAVYGNEEFVTPTLLPALETEKILFQHPQNYYSFEYPSEWIMILSKKSYKDGDWYAVTLTDKNTNNNFKIDFMDAGRGAPYYTYETTEEKVIHDTKISLNTLYRDDTAFEAIVSFPNGDFDTELIGLYLYLPEENQEEFMQQVEEIIASLE